MKRKLLNSLNRNTFLFVAGMAGVAHETLLQHAERPTLLILFAAMMGMPAFLTSTEIFPHEGDKDKRKKQQKMIEESEHATEDRVEEALEEQQELTHPAKVQKLRESLEEKVHGDHPKGGVHLDP